MVTGVNGIIGEEFPAPDTVPVRGININFGNSSMVLVPAKSTSKKNKSKTGNNEECVCLGIYTCAKLAYISNNSDFVKYVLRSTNVEFHVY